VLVVRREEDGVRHYMHVGTGNYHPKTARLYTDLGLLTCDPRLGADLADMFNLLTGSARPRRYRRAVLAPNFMRSAIVDEIDRTIAAHSDERPARILMKMNSLVDGECVRALYRASQAGVQVDLNVRGICCLRPGVPGVSENVRVVSVVGRFLEHSRVYAFLRPDEPASVYIGSADLMPRNLDHRVELLAPLDDGAARAQALDVAERSLADEANAWELRPDGGWERRRVADDEPRSVQRELMRAHVERLPPSV
jgi:polyphosphate kinase